MMLTVHENVIHMYIGLSLISAKENVQRSNNLLNRTSNILLTFTVKHA